MTSRMVKQLSGAAEFVHGAPFFCLAVDRIRKPAVADIAGPYNRLQFRQSAADQRQERRYPGQRRQKTGLPELILGDRNQPPRASRSSPRARRAEQPPFSPAALEARVARRPNFRRRRRSPIHANHPRADGRWRLFATRPRTGTPCHRPQKLCAPAPRPGLPNQVDGGPWLSPHRRPPPRAG